jgi:hypothetical protein
MTGESEESSNRSFRNSGLRDLTGAANYLGISNRALRDLWKRRAVTYAKIDYRNRPFQVCDLEEYLERIRIKAKACTREGNEERFAFSKRNLSAGYGSSLSLNKVRLVDLRRPSLCYRPQNKELST